MNRLPGTLFHTLKGSPGWGYPELITIDIAKVINVGYHRRLFRIFDRDLPYALDLIYYKPEPGKLLGMGICVNPLSIQLVSKRYPSKAVVKSELEEINSKIALLNRFQQKKSQ